MKKLFLLAALALPLSISLTGCSSDTVTLPNEPGQSLPKYANAVVNFDDSNSRITVTKAYDNTYGNYLWNVGTPGMAIFRFTALPGSDAINIIGYRVTSDTINGTDVTDSDDTDYKQMFVYVPSGYVCSDQQALATVNQSCDATLPTTKPATGITSQPFSINLSSSLSDLVQKSEANVYRVTSIEFIGVSSRNEKIILPAVKINTIGVKSGL